MKKIMFNDKYGLTEAVLSGRKTQTRRICKYNRPNSSYDIVFPIFEDKDYDDDNNCISPLDGAFGWGTEDGKFTGWNNPKYKIGEVVAVAQAYNDFYNDECDPRIFPDGAGWTNKMFVRADLMPHRLRITNVRVERLQDISDEDCIKEGVELNPRQYEYDGQKVYFVRNLGHWRSFGCDNFNTPREAYAALIDRISGKGTWDSNPYVFVYDFELVK